MKSGNANHDTTYVQISNVVARNIVKDIKTDGILKKMRIIGSLNLMKRIVLERSVKNMDSKYNHAEAYCLMKYKCEKCGTVETIWNSRDGVTPFIINCEKCNGHMQHIVSWDDKSELIIGQLHNIQGRQLFLMAFHQSHTSFFCSKCT